MAEAAQKEIEVRNEAMYAAFKHGDFEGAAGIYTEEAVFMPPKGPDIQGRAVIKAFFEKAKDMLGVLVVQKLLHFELMNETNAYTNFQTAVMGEDNKPTTLFRDCLIWTKVEGQWYIRRDIFNEMSS